MSQAIIKAGEGTKVNENIPKTIDYLGKKVDANTFLRSVIEGLSDYIVNELGITNRDRRDLVYNSINDLVKGLVGGTIKFDGLNFVDENGKLSNNGKRFDPTGIGATYILRKLKEAPEYILVTDKSKEEKQNKNELQVNLQIQKPRYIDLDLFANNKALDPRQLINAPGSIDRLKDLITQFSNFDQSNSDFTGSRFDNAQSLTTAITNALSALNDENGLDWNSESNYLRILGLNDNILDTYIKPLEEGEKPSTPEEEQRKETLSYLNDKHGGEFEGLPGKISLGKDYYSVDENSKRWLDPDDKKQTITRDSGLYEDYIMNTFIPYFNQYNPFESNDEVALPEDTLNLFNGYNKVFGKDRPELKLNKKEYLSYMLHVLLDDEQLIDNGDGRYILPFTSGMSEKYPKTAILWDPKTNELSIEQTGTLPTIVQSDIKAYQDLHRIGQKIKFEQGGILKFQFGGDYQYVDQRGKDAREKAISTEMAESNRTEEQVLKGQEPVFDGKLGTTDYLRIGSAVGDIASMISAFIPGPGTAISAGTGVGSSISTAAAEKIEGNFSNWQIIKHLGANLGLDLAGLIPYIGNTTSGVTKVYRSAKYLAKYVPWVITSLGAANIALNDDMHIALGKLANGEFDDMSLDDWKQITTAFSSILGSIRAFKTKANFAKMKSQSVVNGQTIPTEYSGKIKLKNGAEVTLTADLWKQINTYLEAGNLKEAEKYLKTNFPQYDNPTIKHKIFNKNKIRRSSYTPGGVEVSPVYDPSKIDSKYYRGGYWSDAEMFGRKFGNYTPPPSPPPAPKALPAPLDVKHWQSIPGGLWYHKRGGILKASRGWRINTNYEQPNLSQLNNTELWDNWYKITDEDIINWISRKELGDTNINALNNVTSFTDNDKIYNKTGYADWNINYNNTGLNDLFGYNPDVNEYMGPSTWNRNKAYGRLVELASRDGGLKTKNGTLTYKTGLGFLFNGNVPQQIDTNQGNEQPITPTPTIAQTSGSIDGSGNKGSKYNATTFKNAWDRVTDFGRTYINPLLTGEGWNPDYLANARVLWTLHNNRLITNKLNDALDGAYKYTYDVNPFIHGNKVQQSAYEDAGNRDLALTKNNLGSDQALNLSAMLEAQDRANQHYIQGNLVNDLAVKDSIKEAFLHEIGNKERHTAVGNENNATAKQVKFQKELNNAELISNRSKVVDTRLQEIQYNQLAKLAKLRELRANATLGKLLLDQLLDKLYQELNRKLLYYETKPDLTDIERLDYENLKIQKALKDIEYQDKFNNIQLNILNQPLYGFYAKRGTKVTIRKKDNKIENDKIFHKSIKDSRDAKVKLLEHLSELTKQLVLKALS